jgi:copper(I)-binding protein
MRVVALILSLASLTGVAACAQSQPRGTGGGFITAGDAWARPAGAGQASAAYLRITNGTFDEDTLIGASTSAAASASIHRTTTDANGLTGMEPATLPIPAGQSVALEPGGYHVMLLDLTGDLAPGGHLELTLTFEHAGPLNVQAEVRAN